MKIFLSSISFLLLLTCSGPKSPSIKIKTGKKDNFAPAGAKLDLNIKTSLEKYNVQYYLNDKLIKSDYQFSNNLFVSLETHFELTIHHILLVS